MKICRLSYSAGFDSFHGYFEQDGKFFEFEAFPRSKINQRQIVIKNLGEFMQNIPGISGGTIMPDGQVGLIIDIAGLINAVNEKDLRTKHKIAA